MSETRRTVTADSSVEKTLRELAQVKGSKHGVVVGQRNSSENSDTVTHVICKERGSSNYDTACDILDICKSLSGGLQVLGFFQVGEAPAFDEKHYLEVIDHLKALVLELWPVAAPDSLARGQFLNLFFSSKNNSVKAEEVLLKPSQRSLVRSNVSFQWLKEPIQWILVESFYEIDQLFAIPKDSSVKTVVKELETQLYGAISQSRVFFNGNPLSQDETLEKLAETSPKKVKGEIYQRASRTKKEQNPVEKCEETIHFSGVVSSRVWAPVSSRARVVEELVRNDVVRSFGSRLHILVSSLEESMLESNQLVIYEPPRRVYFSSPLSRATEYCDYVFPNESVKTVIEQAKKLLNLDLKEEHVLMTVETVGTVSVPEKPTKTATKKKDSSRIYLIGVAVALVVLLLSILLHYSFE